MAEGEAKKARTLPWPGQCEGSVHNCGRCGGHDVEGMKGAIGSREGGRDGGGTKRATTMGQRARQWSGEGATVEEMESVMEGGDSTTTENMMWVWIFDILSVSSDNCQLTRGVYGQLAMVDTNKIPS